MNILTGTIAQVKIGQISIEGLLGSDGNFYIAVVQIAKQFQFDKNQASREFKAILGAGIQFDKMKTKIHPKAINIVRLPEYEKLVFELSLKGNDQAIAFSRALIGLSLHQLFCDAFGQKFEAEDRQQWLKARMLGKETRRTLTDAIADYLKNTPNLSENTHKYIYINVTDAVNRGVFNRSAAKLKEQWHCLNPRDNMAAKELKWIEQVEDLAMRLIDDQNHEPLAAVRQAINTLFIPVVKR